MDTSFILALLCAVIGTLLGVCLSIDDKIDSDMTLCEICNGSEDLGWHIS